MKTFHYRFPVRLSEEQRRFLETRMHTSTTPAEPLSGGTSAADEPTGCATRHTSQTKWLWTVLHCIHGFCTERELLQHRKPGKPCDREYVWSHFAPHSLLAGISVRISWNKPRLVSWLTGLKNPSVLGYQQSMEARSAAAYPSHLCRHRARNGWNFLWTDRQTIARLAAFLGVRSLAGE